MSLTLAGTVPKVFAWSAATAFASRGLPGLVLSCRCIAANGTGLGGGATRATTDRAKISAGGLAIEVAANPVTLVRIGARAAMLVTGALPIWSRETGTAVRAMDCDCTNAAAGTAVTAPGTRRLP